MKLPLILTSALMLTVIAAGSPAMSAPQAESSSAMVPVAKVLPAASFVPFGAPSGGTPRPRACDPRCSIKYVICC